MKYTITLLAASAVLLTTTACSRGDPALPTLIQDKVCEVRAWGAEAAAECRPGQKIAFFPSQWGNEQLPLLFAAVNCDMRYTVAMNNGGVVCIHAKMRVEKEKPAAPAAAK